MGRVGLHSDASSLRDGERWLRTVQNYNAPQLVMNSIQRAEELLPYSPLVIHRWFDPFHEYSGNDTFDNGFVQKHTAHEIINQMRQDLGGANPNLYHTYGWNEPSYHSDRIEDDLDVFIAIMDGAKDMGIRLCIGEFATAKSIQPDDIVDGKWDSFLYALNRHKGWHILGVHEYTTGVLPASHMPDYPRNLVDLHAMQPENWTGNIEWNRIDGALPGNWHLGRVAWLLIRADELGIPRPQFVVTECAWDRMADLDHNHDNFLSSLESIYGMNIYLNNFKGVPSLSRYWQWVLDTFSQQDLCRFGMQQMVWMDRNYPSECLGFCLFAWNDLWNIPRGFDMSLPEWQHYHDLITVYNQLGSSEPPPPEEEPVSREVYISASVTRVHVRDAPNIGGTHIRWLYGDEELVAVISEPIAGGSYLGADGNSHSDWYHMVFHEGEGYVATSYVELEDIFPEPEPESDEIALHIEGWTWVGEREVAEEFIHLIHAVEALLRQQIEEGHKP